jgi:hypothetical protein
LQLKPVGNPHSQPGVLKDLAAAVHDILHGLVDLHKQLYTHWDLRWENCIKVNVQGEWKWVIIHLEAAGCDREEWKGDGLRAWDERTLEDCNGKKIYTKASDMYQIGKLIVQCLATNITCGDEEQDLYRSFNALGEKMQQELPAAAMMHERREDFLEGVERLCVCMCVCVFEDESDLEYEQGVEFATQSAQSANFVHVLSSNALYQELCRIWTGNEDV